MKNNVKEDDGAKARAESDTFATTKEKAQYEIFRNGSLPRETIASWIRNDLTSILSLVSSLRSEKELFDALVDSMFIKYRSLHLNNEKDGKKTNP